MRQGEKNEAIGENSLSATALTNAPERWQILICYFASNVVHFSINEDSVSL
jgi:hypothetical protein